MVSSDTGRKRANYLKRELNIELECCSVPLWKLRFSSKNWDLELIRLFIDCLGSNYTDAGSSECLRMVNPMLINSSFTVDDVKPVEHCCIYFNVKCLNIAKKKNLLLHSTGPHVLPSPSRFQAKIAPCSWTVKEMGPQAIMLPLGAWIQSGSQNLGLHSTQVKETPIVWKANLKICRAHSVQLSCREELLRRWL